MHFTANRDDFAKALAAGDAAQLDEAA